VLMVDHQIDGSELLTKRDAKTRLRRVVLDKWNGCCAYCDEDLGRGATLDHVIPKAHGGVTAKENLVGCCLLCNSQKGHSVWFQWYRQQEFWDPLREEEIWKWINDAAQGCA
jgi:5-methylcytosine-specific restriction endonuclease McrA